MLKKTNSTFYVLKNAIYMFKLFTKKMRVRKATVQELDEFYNFFVGILSKKLAIFSE